MDTFGRQSRAAVRRVLVFLCMLGLIAAADNAAFAEQGNGPCKEDAAKFCKDVQPGGGRIAQCLKGHQSELSPACQQKIAQAKEQRQEFHQACKGDVDAYCKGVQPGGGRIISCLKEHENQLAPSCKEKIAQAKTRRQ